jgi:hypothetical protein
MKIGLLTLCFGSFALVLNLAGETRYVDLNSAIPIPPYTSWSTAATNIQDAVDVALAGDQVFVRNGVYQVGSKKAADGTTNRLVVAKAVTLISVNGPAATLIDGGNTMRCVFLTNNAVLSGFTLTGGTNFRGGGVYCTSTSALVSNCVLLRNTAYAEGGGVYSGQLVNCTIRSNRAATFGTGGDGGGASRSTLLNCTLSSNSAGYMGGGALLCTLSNCIVSGNYCSYYEGGTRSCTLYNCTVTGNTSIYGPGGVGAGTLYNCIVQYNSLTNGELANHFAANLTNCCTVPLPSFGAENFTNAPLFVDRANDDFRLQSNSPCINSGNNSYVAAGQDLDGNSRIIGGRVDVGAYEFQSPSSVLPYAWAQHYSLPTDGSADFTDPDADGMSNYGEWRSDTVPTNALSVLRMVSATNGVYGANVTWQSVATRSYWLERATNIGIASPFHSLVTNLPGNAGSMTFNDTSATNRAPYFYRVGVQ